MSEDKRDKWEMPKPIFRQTSGSLPKGFIKKEESWDDTAEPHRPTAAEPVPAAHDPNNDMLITMYAPPGDLAEKSEFEAKPEAEAESKPAVAPAAAIVPQPSISEQFTLDEAADQSSEKVNGKRGGGGKVLMTIGILVLLAVAGGIVALIYYFYLSLPAENSNF